MKKIISVLSQMLIKIAGSCSSNCPVKESMLIHIDVGLDERLLRCIIRCSIHVGRSRIDCAVCLVTGPNGVLG